MKLSNSFGVILLHFLCAVFLSFLWASALFPEFRTNSFHYTPFTIIIGVVSVLIDVFIKGPLLSFLLKQIPDFESFFLSFFLYLVIGVVIPAVIQTLYWLLLVVVKFVELLAFCFNNFSQSSPLQHCSSSTLGSNIVKSSPLQHDSNSTLGSNVVKSSPLQHDSSSILGSGIIKKNYFSENATYYDMLGIKKDLNLSLEDLKKGYREMTLKTHPVFNRDDFQHAEKAFEAVQKAYLVLSNPALRIAYDAGESIDIAYAELEESINLECMKEWAE